MKKFLPLILGIAAVGVIALLVRTPAPQPPPPATPPKPPPEPAAPVVQRPPPVTPLKTPEPPGDPLLDRWKTAIRGRNQKEVMELQAAFITKEGEYRDPLMAMARTDPDPRVRAFCVAVLGRMKAPPAESFFVERTGDANEYPKRSALEALEKVGTKACLDVVDKLAAGDPVEAVRTTAAQAAKAVRSR